MPHILLSTTSNLAENAHTGEILQALVDRLSACESVSPEAVKAYHSEFAHWRMGVGGAKGFVHCQLGLLTGRTLELRKQIAEEISEVLRREFAFSLSSGEAKVTVELREMEAATYIK